MEGSSSLTAGRSDGRYVDTFNACRSDALPAALLVEGGAFDARAIIRQRWPDTPTENAEALGGQAVRSKRFTGGLFHSPAPLPPASPPASESHSQNNALENLRYNPEAYGQLGGSAGAAQDSYAYADDYDPPSAARNRHDFADVALLQVEHSAANSNAWARAQTRW